MTAPLTKRAEFIRALSMALARVADGDYGVRIDTGGDEEFEAVADAFAAMQVRLRDTVSSLELAVRNLHEKQRALVEAEKLASLGRVAAGIAHEINNPLAVMAEQAGLLEDLLRLRQEAPGRPEYLRLVAGILEQVRRCRSITHRLLGYARRADLAAEEVDLNALARDVREYVGLASGDRGARVDLELAPGLPPVVTDRVQLEEVLVNLLRNAVQAVSPGTGRVALATGLADAGTARISVRDDGPGIPAELLPRIFEPFFTTKERGKGTGLGLFISHGIVKRLGGTIAVESGRGRGTAFTVCLPLRACALGEGEDEPQRPHR